jgi:hypothetical protein
MDILIIVIVLSSITWGVVHFSLKKLAHQMLLDAVSSLDVAIVEIKEIQDELLTLSKDYASLQRLRDKTYDEQQANEPRTSSSLTEDKEPDSTDNT